MGRLNQETIETRRIRRRFQRRRDKKLCEINTMTFRHREPRRRLPDSSSCFCSCYYREQMIGYREEITLDAMLDYNSVFREARWDFLEKKRKKKIVEQVGQCSPILPVASPIYETCEDSRPLSSRHKASFGSLFSQIVIFTGTP